MGAPLATINPTSDNAINSTSDNATNPTSDNDLNVKLPFLRNLLAETYLQKPTCKNLLHPIPPPLPLHPPHPSTIGGP